MNCWSMRKQAAPAPATQHAALATPSADRAESRGLLVAVEPPPGATLATVWQKIVRSLGAQPESPHRPLRTSPVSQRPALPREHRLQARTIDTDCVYRLVNVATQTALGIEGASTALGSYLQLTSHTHGRPTLWRFLDADDASYKIASVYSGQLLSLTTPLGAGARARQWGDVAAAGQRWRALATAQQDVVVFAGEAQNLCLDTDAGGAPSLQAAVANSLSQAWQLVPAGTAYPPPQALTGRTDAHDPCLVAAPTGGYYLYRTGGAVYMQHSDDCIDFVDVGTALPQLPGWAGGILGDGNTDLWAPDVSCQAGIYYMYFAASRFGTNQSAIGLATSSTGAPGSFQHAGIVLQSAAGDSYNAIDPCLFVDCDDSWWLSFGSFFGGIYLAALDAGTGNLKSPAVPYVLLAQRPNTAIEGSHLMWRDDSYYLFVSFDKCCQAAESTYHIMVGRAQNVQGPYLDRAGLAMVDGGGSLLLSNHGDVRGPGGQMVTHEGDNSRLVYHYYDAACAGKASLGINRLVWSDDGWPAVA